MNPRYEDFLNGLREDELLEDVVPETKDTADSDEALKIFGDDFIMVASPDDEIAPTETCPADGDDGQHAPAIHESKPPDIKALHDFLDFHDSVKAAYPAAEQPSSTGHSEDSSGKFALPGLGPESGLVRSQLRKRAVDEVNGLHMIDHVLCAAEREQKKVVSHPHDGLQVKQALHGLLQVLSGEDVIDISIAEKRFIDETQKWLWELYEKDARLAVADLRRYFETTKPALSAKALSALARFYRNAPFSYRVRDKFELVMTRMFSRETLGDKRKAIYSVDLMAKQVGVLYAEWTSLQTYSQDDSFAVSNAARQLEFFKTEAECATSFEELVGDDFFTRLRSFKENLHEEFFSPVVTSAAIDCNVVVGNAFIELLEKERKRESIESLGEKFANACSEDVSEMTAKTIEVAEKLCGDRRKAANAVKVRPVAPVRKKGSFVNKLKSFFTVGPRLFVVLCVLTVSATAMYYGAQRMILKTETVSNVKRVNLENSALKDYVQGATLSGETFVGSVTPGWDGLDGEQKSDVVRKLLAVGQSNGFRYVRLTDLTGSTVASGTPERVEIK